MFRFYLVLHIDRYRCRYKYKYVYKHIQIQKIQIKIQTNTKSEGGCCCFIPLLRLKVSLLFHLLARRNACRFTGIWLSCRSAHLASFPLCFLLSQITHQIIFHSSYSDRSDKLASLYISTGQWQVAICQQFVITKQHSASDLWRWPHSQCAFCYPRQEITSNMISFWLFRYTWKILFAWHSMIYLYRFTYFLSS